MLEACGVTGGPMFYGAPSTPIAGGAAPRPPADGAGSRSAQPSPLADGKGEGDDLRHYSQNADGAGTVRRKPADLALLARVASEVQPRANIARLHSKADMSGGIIALFGKQAKRKGRASCPTRPGSLGGGAAGAPAASNSASANAPPACRKACPSSGKLVGDRMTRFTPHALA